MVAKIPHVNDFLNQVDLEAERSPSGSRPNEITFESAVSKLVEAIEDAGRSEKLDGFIDDQDSIDTAAIPQGFYFEAVMPGRISVRTVLRLQTFLTMQGWRLSVPTTEGIPGRQTVFVLQPRLDRWPTT